MLFISQPTFAKKWEGQIRHALELSKHISPDSQIILTDYKHIGTIDSEKKRLSVVKKIFADNASTIINTDDRFSLITWGEIRDNDGIADRAEQFKSRIAAIIQLGQTDVVELSWFHARKNYKSLALVDDRGIIYDNIASFAIDYTAPQTPISSTTRHTQPLPDEVVGLLPANMANQADNFHVTVLSRYADKRVLLTGETAWGYDSFFISVFDKNGKLYYRTSKSESSSSTGWLCTLKSGFSDGEIDQSSYNQYLWEWGCDDSRFLNGKHNYRSETHTP